MNPASQLWHIAKHDIIHLRWVLVAYIAVAAAATIKCLETTGPNISFVDSSPQLLPFAMMSTAAMLARCDAWSDSNTFWINKPLHPALLLLAKVLTIAIVIDGIALIAQTLVLRHFRVAPMSIPICLIDSIGPLTGYSVSGLVVGSLIRNNKTFVIALLLCGVFSTVTLTPTSPASDFLMRWHQAIYTAIGLSVSLGLVRFYRRRGVTRSSLHHSRWRATDCAALCSCELSHRPRRPAFLPTMAQHRQFILR